MPESKAQRKARMKAEKKAKLEAKRAAAKMRAALREDAERAAESRDRGDHGARGPRHVDEVTGTAHHKCNTRRSR